MNQNERLQQAADALASVSGMSPVAAKRVLREYDTRDLIASVAAEGVGGGNGAAGGSTLLGPFAIVRALWLAVEDEIAVAIYTTGGGLTAGAGNVYALVSTV